MASLIELLVALGANINVRSEDDATLLDVALLYGLFNAEFH